MASDSGKVVAKLSKNASPNGRSGFEVREASGDYYVYDAMNKHRICEHVNTFDALTHWIKSRPTGSEICPLCEVHKNVVSRDVSASASLPALVHVTKTTPIGLPMGQKGETFDEYFYSLFNKERDWSAPQFLTPETLYRTDTGVRVIKDQTWEGVYEDMGLGIKGSFEDRDGKKHNRYHISYDIFEPSDLVRGDVLPLVVLTHGVPMNRREWYAIARILGRFCRVVVYDILGMGDSSVPLDFKPRDNEPRSKYGNKDWHWSWRMHANIFKQMLEGWRREHPIWFEYSDRVFFCANDWGSGIVQKVAEKFSGDLLGAGIYSAIAFNGYWVQHIGALQALAMLPYPSPTFTAEAVRFAGVLTALLETMFHKTSEHINQYSMAPFQHPYVEISYDNVNKNPSNTIYKEHAIRVLSQQASTILGNGELLPYHHIENPRGLKFSKWNTPIQVLNGRQDLMMPETQRHRFSLLVEHLISIHKEKGTRHIRLSFRERSFEEAGHFAIRDQPLGHAHEMITWFRSIVGPRHLHMPYIGLEGIARQDEQRVMHDLEKF